mgnify:CR=1 FL=1
MGGIGFGNSYINLKGGKMQYLEASVGASFPIRYSYLSLGARGGNNWTHAAI